MSIVVPAVDVSPSLEQNPAYLLVPRGTCTRKRSPALFVAIVDICTVGEQKPYKLRIMFHGRAQKGRAMFRISGMDVHATGPEQHFSYLAAILPEILTGNKQGGTAVVIYGVGINTVLQ
jgi:hypothetical protein